MRKFLKSWWDGLRYEPGDPRQRAGGIIKIAAIGGGTGLASVLRGLKSYSNYISAIVTVTDDGGLSSGKLREEFDILPPGDIRQCISVLAYDEELISNLLEYRFHKDNNSLSGHTLGNIWITALTNYFGSFEKAIEVTSEIFRAAGKVLPATLEKIDLCIDYVDGESLIGEHNLDELTKKIKEVSLSKKNVRASTKAIEAIAAADLILIGPGSLYGSVIPNLLIRGIREAVKKNHRAVKIYIANCSTERTQTCNYSVSDHIKAVFEHTKTRLFDYCLVNSRVLRRSKDASKLGEINNITTTKNEMLGVKIVREDVIDSKNPLLHDPQKLAKSLIELYNEKK